MVLCINDLSFFLIFRTFSEIPESTWLTFLPAARQLVLSLNVQSENESTKKTKKSKKSKSRKTHSDEDEITETKQNGEMDGIPPTTHERALCCALAKIAGKLKTIEKRSVLSANSGHTAYRLDIPEHISAQRKGLCYSLLGKKLESEITESIRNLSFIKGRTVSFKAWPVSYSERNDITNCH